MKLSLANSTLFLVLLLGSLAALTAQETDPDPLTSIHGKAVFPKELPEGINREGLLLKDAIVTLEGKYNHPRMPYPENWRQMTREKRETWSIAFTNSDDYPAYQRKVEQARAKRFTTTAEIAEDGSFLLEGIKPAWYQLTVKIMHPSASEKASNDMARAFAMHQFFVKSTAKPKQIGELTLKLKNVLKPGDTAPDFSITDYNGSTFKLSDLRGKVVLFDFWATWCGPCIAQIPNLEAVSKKFDGERFATLGLSVDAKLEDAKAFLEKNPSHYRQGHVGTEAHYAPLAKAYGIESIPSIWLIDPEGNIIARNLIGPNILKAVEKALGETGSPP